MRYVTIEKASDLTGYTPDAIRSKIKRGDWLEGGWQRAPDGRVLIDLQGYEKWVEGKLATPGVRVRTTQSIEIDFYYRGVRCLRAIKASAEHGGANRRYASRLKAEIESRIARGEFNYAEFFPDSPRARTLLWRAGDAITVREVLRQYVDASERSLQRSTWLDYKRSVDSNLNPAFGDLHLSEVTRAKLREWAWVSTSPQSAWQTYCCRCERSSRMLLPMRSLTATCCTVGSPKSRPSCATKPRSIRSRPMRSG